MNLLSYSLGKHGLYPSRVSNTLYEKLPGIYLRISSENNNCVEVSAPQIEAEMYTLVKGVPILLKYAQSQPLQGEKMREVIDIIGKLAGMRKSFLAFVTLTSTS